MSAPFPSALIYLLGFIGLVSIGLLPLRCWQVLTRAFGSRQIQTRGKVLAVFAMLAMVGALWFEVRTTARIFKCLTETYCGPNIASGWIYLAMLGVVYLVFEALIFVMKKIGLPKAARAIV